MPSSPAHKVHQLLQSGRSSVTLHPKLFPTGPGISRADSSKEVRIKSLVFKAVLWARGVGIWSRMILFLLEQHQAGHKVRLCTLGTTARKSRNWCYLSFRDISSRPPAKTWLGSENNCMRRTGAAHRGLHRPLQGKSLCSTLPAGLSTQTRTAKQILRWTVDTWTFCVQKQG